MTQVLSHQFSESNQPFGGDDLYDLMTGSFTQFDFPLFPTPCHGDELPCEPRHHVPQPLDFSQLSRSRLGSGEEEWALQESPSPYTGLNTTQGGYPLNPRLRVQQSTPFSTSSPSTPATPPPMSTGGNWVSTDWSHIPDQNQAYLSPTSTTFNSPQQTYRGHKRLSSGSSATSAGPNSPYISSSVYPQIVDPDNLSASSPRLDFFDPSLQQYSAYEKPLYYQHPSPLQRVSFVEPFENLRLASSEQAQDAMGRRNRLSAQAQTGGNGQEEITQAGLGRTLSRGDTVNGEGLVRNIPMLNRTVSNVYADELVVPQPSSTPPRPSAQRRSSRQAGSSQSHANSTVTHRLQEAQAIRAQQARQPSSISEASQESPYSQGSEIGLAVAAEQRQQRQQQQQTISVNQMRGNSRAASNSQIMRDHQVPLAGNAQGAVASASEIMGRGDDRTTMVVADGSQNLDSLGRPAKNFQQPEVAALGAAVNSITKGKPHTVTNNIALPHADLNYAPSSSASLSNKGGHNTISPKISSGSNTTSSSTFYHPLQPSSQGPITGNINPQYHSNDQSLMMGSHSGPATTSAGYPFITSSLRRQSTSHRSEQNDAPTFPPSLPSMESTRSESSREPNVRPPVFNRQDTSASTPRSEVASPRQRPVSTTANTGTYQCSEPGCNARFPEGKKLAEHRRSVHRSTARGSSAKATNSAASDDAASPRTSSTASSTPQINPQAEINNQSRNSAPGPHRCTKHNPTTGRTCGAIFSRSYDLTRHEETIHSSSRPRIKCEHCVEDKTFSRTDALTRHMRVVHPDIAETTPAKNRRRG